MFWEKEGGREKKTFNFDSFKKNQINLEIFTKKNKQVNLFVVTYFRPN